MGAGASVDANNGAPALTPRVAATIEAKTHLSADELQLLGQHFQRYQVDGTGGVAQISTDTASLPTGSIDRVKFQQAMGLPEKESLYADRLFQVIDTNHDGRISFDEFAQSVALLSTKAPMADKTKRKTHHSWQHSIMSFHVVSFQILDMDGDGLLSKDEVTSMLHTSLAENKIELTKDQIHHIVERTWTDIGLAANDSLSFDKYTEVVARSEGMLSHLTINLSYLLNACGVQTTLAQPT
ncbi:hypothetical protein AeMF1_009722 [Aphanomyces euteiches]|nr:hypothetical protein AeMF1_009722 [Aphanomyces euteiches]KAH9190771.1 hypothetical protein AeNC1_007253 [Aphanomyces euteiches]